jgi:hypothetical protein
LKKKKKKKKAVVGLIGLLLLFTFAGCSGERFVDEVVLSNPTAYVATVEVNDGAGSGALSLATVPARSEVTVKEVIDQGPTWSFRFTYAGYEEGMRLSRSQLQRSDWHVVIPESFETALRDRGVVPPP